MLAEEVLVVLSLSLLPSAVDAIISLASAPLAGVAVSVYGNAALASQLSSIVFGLAPVALVVHLVRRGRDPLDRFGLGTSTIRRDAGAGVLLGLGVALVGLAIYIAAVALKVNRFVVPVPPTGHWWTVPVLVLGAMQAALLEETVAVGYLIRRLEQIGWSGTVAVVTSAVLRASYHLYQGWGGFAGNMALGLAFGSIFWRWRRVWPLVFAHASVDILAGVAYLVYRGHCYFGACIR
jgi:membrane protease YdiL (CAAX protease family)